MKAWTSPTRRRCATDQVPKGKSKDETIMWVEFKRAPNLMAAEVWKEVLEAEGLPSRILPEGDIRDWSERVPFRIYVPKGREHVAEEIVRKL